VCSQSVWDTRVVTSKGVLGLRFERTGMRAHAERISDLTARTSLREAVTAGAAEILNGYRGRYRHVQVTGPR
jgi:hypothetical protein